MSLFHSRPVTVQRTYIKPSTMSRLKTALSPNHHHQRPRTVAIAPRRTGHKRVAARQPVKTGLFHRSNPRRTVVANQKRGFLGLKTRHNPAAVSGRGHSHHKKNDKHHHGHKGSILIALLALFTMKKKHDHDKHHHEKK